ncbi:MAG: sugar phosphate isomerase/epimerase family protein [Clostridia bacterium]
MQNKVGIYYAFWEQEWRADYLAYVHKIARLGFDTLEVAAGALPGMTSEARKTIAQAARDEGLDMTYCIGLPAAYDLASPDAKTRKTGIAYMGTLFDCLSEMGGDLLGGIIYTTWPGTMNAPLTDKSPWWNRSVESVRKYSKMAEDAGILCCMEVVNRFEQYLLNTAAEGVAFVKRLESPNVKLLLDTFHMNIEEDFIGQSIRKAGSEYIGHFHIGETNRRVPGRGHMPWDEIMDALCAINYEGRIVMEPFLKMGGQVGQDIKVWRDLSDDGDDAFMDAEAQYALKFMKGKLASR